MSVQLTSGRLRVQDRSPRFSRLPRSTPPPSVQSFLKRVVEAWEPLGCEPGCRVCRALRNASGSKVVTGGCGSTRQLVTERPR